MVHCSYVVITTSTLVYANCIRLLKTVSESSQALPRWYISSRLEKTQTLEDSFHEAVWGLLQLERGEILARAWDIRGHKNAWEWNLTIFTTWEPCVSSVTSIWRHYHFWTRANYLMISVYKDQLSIVIRENFCRYCRLRTYGGANKPESTVIIHLDKHINLNPEWRIRESTMGLNSEKNKAGPLANPALFRWHHKTLLEEMS